MTARKNLGAMLGGAVDPAGTVTPLRAEEITPPSSRAETVVAVPTSRPSAKWLTFERKETRQRADQIEWIEAKRKELNNCRGGVGERLTDNTLIRVALDLLMQRGGELRGTTEDELRRSLGIGQLTGLPESSEFGTTNKGGR